MPPNDANVPSMSAATAPANATRDHGRTVPVGRLARTCSARSLRNSARALGRVILSSVSRSDLWLRHLRKSRIVPRLPWVGNGLLTPYTGDGSEILRPLWKTGTPAATLSRPVGCQLRPALVGSAG